MTTGIWIEAIIRMNHHNPSRIYFKFLMLFCKYERVETLSVADGETMRTAVLLFYLILCS